MAITAWSAKVCDQLDLPCREGAHGSSSPAEAPISSPPQQGDEERRAEMAHARRFRPFVLHILGHVGHVNGCLFEGGSTGMSPRPSLDVDGSSHKREVHRVQPIPVMTRSQSPSTK